jgi:hypothetical protein
MKKNGLLIASGIITGEALIGIGVALPIFITGEKYWWPQISGFEFLGPILFLMVIVWFYKNVIK